ncbi:MAG TPA: M20 family metallopeptidase [Tepidisphaeraceae bacterium]|jgi:amidohydrolase|nr:M20 family metallopeptidase [Tepidisphaeraceae bacterium]
MTTDTLFTSAVQHAVELRHQLHRIPELGYQEFKTATAIRAELDRLNIHHVDGVPEAETATIAWFGDTAKPCVALRADIDALPIVERTGVPYASIHEGRMHACGHDGHTATLLGAAAVLKSREHELPVCVKLIFQPAEEGGGGGEVLCDAGVLDGRIGPKVTAIFGLHGWPGLPVGTVATKPGPLLAATDNFRATFVGRGCHGAFPHLGRDPIVTACEAVLNLQQFVSRETDPGASAVVTVGVIRAGSATNIIPDSATIQGTARTLLPEQRVAIARSIQRRCHHIAAANDCTLQFEWAEGYPPTINDPQMADYVARVARTTVGAAHFLPVGRPSMGGEDFAYYLQQVPGCFFLIGVEAVEAKVSYPLHNEHFNFADGAVEVGMRMFVDLVRRFGDGQ